MAALTVGVTGSLLAVTGPSANAGLVAPGNSDAIFIRDAANQTTNPYPSSVTMWGIDGPITDINVDLNYVTMGYPGDLEILLVSPSGTAVMLMSDACSKTVTERYWTIDDEAGDPFPPSEGPASQLGCGSGSWKPTNWEVGPGRELPAPAPPPSGTYPYYGRTMSAFDGENPNGTWKLYVEDDTNRAVPADKGVILYGFRLIITTQSRTVVIPAGGDGGGPATQYPVVESVSGKNGRIEDVSVYLRNLSHNRPDDIDMLLVAPGGQKVLLMSDACGGIPIPNGLTFRISDGDPPMPDHGICGFGPGGSGINFSPTDYLPADDFPAPAPPGPYGTSLSALRGTNPNGDWRLYIHDDLTDRSGYLEDFSVFFKLGPPVDLTAPDTTITGRPTATTRSRRAQFTFTANEAPATFQCRLDERAWSSCTSPRIYSRLAFGRHVFRVRATDAAGNRDTTPATWTWRVRR